MAKKKFELTQAVWTSGSEQLPLGATVTFPDDEPTGIFIGRVRELTAGGDAIEVASPKVKPGTDGSELMPAETSSDAEPVAPAPAPPPAAKK